MSPLPKPPNNLSGQFSGLLQRVISAILGLRHKFFSCFSGRPIIDREHDGVTSAGSPTFDTGTILHEPPPKPISPPCPPLTPPNDFHLLPAQRCKKKALLVGVESVSSGRSLKGPHKDVRDMCQLLIGRLNKPYFGYSINHISDRSHYDPNDITLLVNTDDPTQIQPTKANIVSFLLSTPRVLIEV